MSRTTMISGTIRIGIQSPDRLRREALAAYLGGIPAFSVVGHVAGIDEAASLCALEHPDLMLVDLGAPGIPGNRPCQSFRKKFPEVQLVAMYEHLTAEELADCQTLGIEAVVPYAHGIRAVVATLKDISERLTGTPPVSGLSDRQREILLLMASGHSVTEIAELLGISTGTVEHHKRKVYGKLSATSATQAVAHAADLGIIDGVRRTPMPHRPTNGSEVAAAVPPETPAAPDLPSWEWKRLRMVSIVGRAGEDLDRVVATLARHGFPILRESPSNNGADPASHPASDPASHPASDPDPSGWAIRVLVNPEPHHWQAGYPSRRTVVVHNGDPGVEPGPDVPVSGEFVFVPARQVRDLLVPAVTLLSAGYGVLDRRRPDEVTRAASPKPAERDPLRMALTMREHDILLSIQHGDTLRQTARTLGIAVKTVENTRSQLFRKLGVRNCAEALSVAHALGMLPARNGAGQP